MKVMRYRKPSLNTLLGVTKAKRQVKRELGISQIQAWTKPSRVKQRAKYRLGLYSAPARTGRSRTSARCSWGTSMRPGEALGLRPCGVVETRTGIVVDVQGTVQAITTARGAILTTRAPESSGLDVQVTFPCDR
jgi:hypothetical protein